MNTVVLPAPLGPIKAKIELRRTLRLTSLSALMPPNCIIRLSTERMISSLMAPLLYAEPHRYG
ncbi:hypothetical protein D3C76_1627940 [compost metagenome]